MVDRVTGRVVHIDFADCFEVAMQRDKFPEKVPFRLTRMLVNAMEVCMHVHVSYHTVTCILLLLFCSFVVFPSRGLYIFPVFQNFFARLRLQIYSSLVFAFAFIFFFFFVCYLF